jgi:hypothetical protein
MGGQVFAREREELGWYYAGLGPTLGLGAASAEPGSRGIFDDKRSHEAHMHRRRPAHRSEMARLALVERAIVISQSPKSLSQIFTPFGAGRASYRLTTAFLHDGQSLIGLAVGSDTIFRLWESRLPTDDDRRNRFPTTPETLQLLEFEVSGLRRGNRIPTGHRLMSIFEECVETYTWSMTRYADARAQAYQEQRAERARTRQLMVERTARDLAGVGFPVPAQLLAVGIDDP